MANLAKYNLLLNNIKAKMLIISNFLFSNLSNYPEIGRKCFITHRTLNFNIAGANHIMRLHIFTKIPNFSILYLKSAEVTYVEIATEMKNTLN